MKSKVIWSIDALHRDQKLSERIVNATRGLDLLKGASIEPVYVLSPEALHMTEDEFTAGFITRFSSGIQRTLGQTLFEAKVENLLPLQVIVQPDFSRSCTEALADYAAESGAEMIVVNTEQHKGISRLLLGSFSEALIADSPVPVLALPSPLCENAEHLLSLGKVKSIVVPVDFTLTSRTVYAETLRMAAEMEAEIILYHRVFGPMKSSEIEANRAELAKLASGTVLDPDPALLDDWLAQADYAGVKTGIFLQSAERSRMGTAEGILRAAERYQAGLIAMAAHTGPISVSSEGRISRDVLESATCPVWIHHPRPARKPHRTVRRERFEFTPEAETGT